MAADAARTLYLALGGRVQMWTSAGLRTYGRGGLEAADLLASLPGSREPVLCDAFVPDHRCGAVPDFNRVPSCDA